jgi:hypothetical protein
VFGVKGKFWCNWLDWAGVEFESEIDALIGYAVNVHVLNWIKTNLELGYDDDVEFPD